MQHKRPHEPVEKILAAAQTKYEEHKTLLETKYQTGSYYAVFLGLIELSATCGS